MQNVLTGAGMTELASEIEVVKEQLNWSNQEDFSL
jgi:hypothetical protein